MSDLTVRDLIRSIQLTHVAPERVLLELARAGWEWPEREAEARPLSARTPHRVSVERWEGQDRFPPDVLGRITRSRWGYRAKDAWPTHPVQWGSDSPLGER